MYMFTYIYTYFDAYTYIYIYNMFACMYVCMYVQSSNSVHTNASRNYLSISSLLSWLRLIRYLERMSPRTHQLTGTISRHIYIRTYANVCRRVRQTYADVC